MRGKQDSQVFGYSVGLSNVLNVNLSNVEGIDISWMLDVNFDGFHLAPDTCIIYPDNIAR